MNKKIILKTVEEVKEAARIFYKVDGGQALTSREVTLLTDTNLIYLLTDGKPYCLAARYVIKLEYTERE